MERWKHNNNQSKNANPNGAVLNHTPAARAVASSLSVGTAPAGS